MCGSDGRKFWKTVKSMENKCASPHLPISMVFNDIVISDKQRMASLLISHFVNATKAFITTDSGIAPDDMVNMATVSQSTLPSPGF